MLGPFLSQIDGKTQLIIIPDASAFLIPFEALIISNRPDSGKYLIERYTVTYHMSLGHLINKRESPIRQIVKTRSVLLVGNPTISQPVSLAGLQERAGLAPLAGAQREVERVREIIGATNLFVYTGEDARKELFRGQFYRVAVIHFATHGV